jgi:hypothetical protein
MIKTKLMLLFPMTLFHFKCENSQVVYEKLESSDQKHLEYNIIKQESKNEFLEKLAWRESRNQWKIYKGSYIGKYQIGKLALKEIGMDSISIEKFKSNPEHFPESLQDKTVIELINKNRYYLRNYINKYSNSYVHGVYITESGILGAAHLVGQKNVKEWLDSKRNPLIKDGNGTTAKSYFEMFANYSI